MHSVRFFVSSLLWHFAGIMTNFEIGRSHGRHQGGRGQKMVRGDHDRSEKGQPENEASAPFPRLPFRHAFARRHFNLRQTSDLAVGVLQLQRFRDVCCREQIITAPVSISALPWPPILPGGGGGRGRVFKLEMGKGFSTTWENAVAQCEAEEGLLAVNLAPSDLAPLLNDVMDVSFAILSTLWRKQPDHTDYGQSCGSEVGRDLLTLRLHSFASLRLRARRMSG